MHCPLKPLREAFNKKTHPTLPISDIEFSDIFSIVQTHPTLRFSDLKSILFSIVYPYQIGNGVRWFEIEHLKGLNPLTLIVKLLLLTITGDEMFLNS